MLVYEMQTSAWQARYFSAYASRITYQLEEGRSDAIAFPRFGPFDERRGYTQIPTFSALLAARGYAISAQARQSHRLRRLLERGISPPYREPPAVGLMVRGPDGTVLFDAAHSTGVFERFEDIPSVIVDALLFIENRELLTPFDPRSNPAIEWDRMLRATLLFGAGKLGFPIDLQGGSTLAVQLEKFRHSPAGRTSSARDKLHQLFAASLKAYREGEDTRDARRQIVVDYLNTLPLSAAPGYGEVYGLGNGLRAWFGVELADILGDLAAPSTTPQKLRSFKQVMTLLAAVRAPTGYLINDRQALEQRVTAYLGLMAQSGKLDPAFADAVLSTPVEFPAYAPSTEPPPFIERKGLHALRTNLMNALHVSNPYDLNRLHLTVESTVDAPLQQGVTQLLLDLGSTSFVREHNLTGERMLRSGDPSKVIHSLVLFERTPHGNVARVHTDNLDRPFDINDGIKMELGSTAKARTLAHYLELIAILHRELVALDGEPLKARRDAAADPLTKWVAETLLRQPDLPLAELLDQSLDRRYSASPGEVFFTGGGVHTFGNFDRQDNGRTMPVREALRKSTNLVFIRIMRDLVRYHQARLPYDATAVMKDQNHPARLQLLGEIADAEGRRPLRRAFERFQGEPPEIIADRLLGKRADSPRHRAILFFAWKIGSDEAALGQWLSAKLGPQPPAQIKKLYNAYRNPRLTIADFGYLLSIHPLEVWVSQQLVENRDLTWDELLERSGEARRTASAWLLKPRNRRAQDVRLRTRIEQDAFERMTPYWQRLGFPFRKLVPSLATSIGNSSDRPIALADFMGILVNDGIRRPLRRMSKLRFAEGTPYETHLEASSDAGVRVMEPEVAAALRAALADVVENGTARRLRGAFRHADGTPAVVGGKTGSGDNRHKTFSRGGGVTSARAVNRTATFIFFIDDRYFGVMTAYVPGKDAAQFEFTSALPVTVLRMAAPAINARL